MADPQILLDYDAHGLALADRPGILDDLREALDANLTADLTFRLRSAFTALDAELGRRAVAYHLGERDRLLEIATRPGNSQAVADILHPLITAAEGNAARVADHP